MENLSIQIYQRVDLSRKDIAKYLRKEGFTREYILLFLRALKLVRSNEDYEEQNMHWHFLIAALSVAFIKYGDLIEEAKESAFYFYSDHFNEVTTRITDSTLSKGYHYNSFTIKRMVNSPELIHIANSIVTELKQPSNLPPDEA